jgi:hypothetical protein
MGSTTRFGLRWPELTDAPNGPAQLQTLAQDSDGWLCRAYRCTSSTRPTGVPDDFLIRESDTGNLYVWTGSAWSQIAGSVSSGGGGGEPAIGTVSATYAATSAQPIATGTDVVVAFGQATTTSSEVTRSTFGAGHQFTLGQTRLWIVSATLRFSQNASGGRTFELRTGSGTVLAKESGPQNQDAPYTANLTCARALPSGTKVHAIARHNAGTSLALEPSSGDYVHIDIAGI